MIPTIAFHELMEKQRDEYLGAVNASLPILAITTEIPTIKEVISLVSVLGV